MSAHLVIVRLVRLDQCSEANHSISRDRSVLVKMHAIGWSAEVFVYSPALVRNASPTRHWCDDSPFVLHYLRLGLTSTECCVGSASSKHPFVTSSFPHSLPICRLAFGPTSWPLAYPPGGIQFGLVGQCSPGSWPRPQFVHSGNELQPSTLSSSRCRYEE